MTLSLIEAERGLNGHPQEPYQCSECGWCLLGDRDSKRTDKLLHGRTPPTRRYLSLLGGSLDVPAMRRQAD